MATPEEFFKPNKKLLLSLSRYVKSHRIKQGLTQKELAEQCGFHYKFIQTLETKKRNISISAFIQLAVGLKINPGNLLNKLLQPNQSK